MRKTAALDEGGTQVQGCFVFTVPDGLSERPSTKVFRDPFGPYLLTRVASALSADGFEVTKVQRGRACDAGFTVRLGRLVVEVALFVRRSASAAECGLLTWCHGPFLRRVWRRPLEKHESDEWNRVSAAIEGVLREDLRDLNLVSVLRLTRKQAERRWAGGR